MASEQSRKETEIRCKHCGMPQDRQTLDGSCPHCTDIYPLNNPHPEHATRCDGCGHERSESSCKTFTAEDDETILGTYCCGCQQTLGELGIAPGGHDQYKLREGSA